MRAFFSILFIFLTIEVTAAPQTNFADSIIHSLGNVDDSTLVTKLNIESFKRVIVNDSNGLLLARTTKVLSQQKNIPAGVADATNVIGIYYDINGQYDSSEYYFKMFLDYSMSMNDTLRIGRANNNLGMFNWHRGNFDEAIDYFYTNLNLSEKIDYLMGVSVASNNIGLIYMEMNQYSKALEYSKKAYRIRKTLEDYKNLGSSCNNIGVCFKNLELYDSALVYYQEGIEYARKENVDSQLAELYTNLGNLYRLVNNPEKGFRNLSKSLEYRPSQISKVDTYLSLSEVLIELNKPEDALHYAKLAYEIRKQHGVNAGFMQYNYRVLANAYYASNDFEKAQKYYIKWGEAKDSVYAAEHAESIAKLETKYQTEKRENELLQKENEVAQSEILVMEKSRQVWMLSAGSFLLMLLGGFLFYRSRQRQKVNLAQVRIEEQQKGLATVIHAQEEERKRIAKDLHDGIVQQLSGIHLGLQKIFAGDETEETQKIMRILSDSTQEIRELSHRMMPRALSELGLIPALEDMLENSMGHSNIRYKFEHFNVSNRYPEHLEIAIYRIAQELINNVIKHSNARNVHVQIFETDGNLMLIVEDDGKGIHPTNSGHGIGLMNISSRLDTINGKVNIEPSPGSGTLATVKIPLSKNME